MKKNYTQSLLFFILLLTSFFVVNTSFASSQPSALLINIDDAIGPASSAFFESGINQAIQQQDNLIILKLNTPGGLDKSMREMVKAIINSPIPIVTYVAPSGARAASAGVYILYASHIAAMAPGTNVGAATPVNLGAAEENPANKKNQSAMEKKAVQDATAYIRSLAELRQRNVRWTEQAVIKSESISANQALQLHVIDIVANDVPDLLQQLNGKQVVVQGKLQTLSTEKMNVTTLIPNWRSQLLSVITDPSVAYILLMVGIWGLFFEFANPGFVLPGVIGGISLVLALYALQLLPVNYAGLALIFLGIAFLIAEAFVTSFGSLGLGGIIAILFGSIFLLDTSVPGFQIAWQLILAVTVVTSLFFLLIINIALRSRFKQAVTGKEELINKTAVVTKDQHGSIRVLVMGEWWQARSEYPLKEGEKVKIIGVDGLTLIIVPEKIH